MRACSICSSLRLKAAAVLVAGIGATGLFASSNLGDTNPSEWTGREIYEILNNSPWSKPLKVNLTAANAGALANDNPAPPTSAPAAPMAGGGRRGMGGGGGRSTYNSSAARSGSPNIKTGPTEVTVQWQSALVVREAAAKKAGDSTDPASFKPLNEYVIAVIGLPTTAIGGRAASADTEATLTQDEEERIEAHVKSSTTLLRSGHKPLEPTKVALDQGVDGRMLVYFPKSDPITANEKSVEFRLAMGKTKFEKKFSLKEMESNGKLEL